MIFFGGALTGRGIRRFSYWLNAFQRLGDMCQREAFCQQFAKKLIGGTCEAPAVRWCAYYVADAVQKETSLLFEFVADYLNGDLDSRLDILLKSQHESADVICLPRSFRFVGQY